MDYYSRNGFRDSSSLLHLNCISFKSSKAGLVQPLKICFTHFDNKCYIRIALHL